MGIKHTGLIHNLSFCRTKAILFNTLKLEVPQGIHNIKIASSGAG